MVPQQGIQFFLFASDLCSRIDEVGYHHVCFVQFSAHFTYLFANYLDLPKIPANHHHVGLELLALSTQSVTLSVTANLDLYPNLTPLLDVDLHLTSPLTIHTIGMDNEIHPFLAEVF